MCPLVADTNGICAQGSDREQMKGDNAKPRSKPKAAAQCCPKPAGPASSSSKGRGRANNSKAEGPAAKADSPCPAPNAGMPNAATKAAGLPAVTAKTLATQPPILAAAACAGKRPRDRSKASSSSSNSSNSESNRRPRRRTGGQRQRHSKWKRRQAAAGAATAAPAPGAEAAAPAQAHQRPANAAPSGTSAAVPAQMDPRPAELPATAGTTQVHLHITALPFAAWPSMSMSISCGAPGAVAPNGASLFPVNLGTRTTTCGRTLSCPRW